MTRASIAAAFLLVLCLSLGGGEKAVAQLYLQLGVIQSLPDASAPESVCLARSLVGVTESVYMAVGYPLDENPSGVVTGSVRIYQYVSPSWVLMDTIFPPDGEAGDMFGSSVGLTAMTSPLSAQLYVGAPGRDAAVGPFFSAINVGAVYEFDLADQGGQLTWIHDPGSGGPDVPKFLPPENPRFAHFGFSLSINDGPSNRLVVGAPYESVGRRKGESEAGAVYVYDSNAAGSPLIKRIPCPNITAAGENHFGFSVSAGYDHFEKFNFVAGAPGESYGTKSEAGAAYYFQNYGTNPEDFYQQRLIDVAGASNDRFGFSVSICTPQPWGYDDELYTPGPTLIVGAPYDDELAIDDGSASVFIPKNPADEEVIYVLDEKLVSQPEEPIDLDEAWFGYAVEACQDLDLAIGNVDPHSLFIGSPGRDFVDDANNYYEKHGVVEYRTRQPNGGGGTSWQVEDWLYGSLLASDTRFGSAVSIWAGDIYVGVIASFEALAPSEENVFCFEKFLD